MENAERVSGGPAGAGSTKGESAAGPLTVGRRKREFSISDYLESASSWGEVVIGCFRRPRYALLRFGSGDR